MASITDTVVSGVNNILNVFSPQTVDANKDLSSGDSKESEEMDVDDESGTYKIIFLGKDGEPVETIDISQGNINLHLDDSIRVVKNKIIGKTKSFIQGNLPILQKQNSTGFK